MITWVTVWILTVQHINDFGVNGKNSHTYQLQYATQKICERQRKNHESGHNITSCDFQQIPLVKSAKRNE